MAAKRSASYLAIVKSRLNMAVLKDRGAEKEGILTQWVLDGI
jgi:hypothetical protein